MNVVRASRRLPSVAGTVVLLALAASCRAPSVVTAPEASAEQARGGYEPSLDLGPLFHDVQLAALFPDSKTFADARPTSAPASIVARYRAERSAPGFSLGAFVAAHFELPHAVGAGQASDTTRSMEEHIRALWPVLARAPDANDARSSLIPLPNAYVVPGGRFREVYYWDSYFTMQGLVESGRTDLVRSMLDNFAHLIRTVGHVPNGNRRYYLGRSQPPYFAAMVGLYATATDTAQALRYLEALEAEHAFWMAGSDGVAAGSARRRVVRLPNGALLNRYWDDIPAPRPESYREDYTLAQSMPADRREALYRSLRASAESGWDFSSRWMRDPRDLRTLETTELAPVDLNSLLANAERTIAALRRFRGQGDDRAVADRYAQLADARRTALLAAAYDSASGFFYDVRWRTGEPVTDRPTLAAAAPLYFGLATPAQARAVAARLERDFLSAGGFVTTLVRSGQQWDAPNGWAPLQWLTIEGVRRYGRGDLADRARDRWLALNRRVFESTGKMMEKYDVADLSRPAGGGEYPNQDGFGWTNGVALALSAQQSAERPSRAPAGVPQGGARDADPQVQLPVLSFPEAGLDDLAAYEGYRTRFHRDAARNTVQLYVDRRANRVVHLWANSANESIGFSARDATGRPAVVRWGTPEAQVGTDGRRRWVSHELVAEAAELHLGWFVLGSMRFERDLQYSRKQHRGFAEAPFVLPEFGRLLGALRQLDAPVRDRHLALLGLHDTLALERRLAPPIERDRDDATLVARIVKPSLDGRDTLTLELRADPGAVEVVAVAESVSVRARRGESIALRVRITTTSPALTPLAREEIFNPAFLAFLDSVRAEGARAPEGSAPAIHARRLERQTRGVELLASREKLMAGLPTYATYFGRDMLVAALMMRPIWRGEMSEHVIASVLRKLSPTGEVSHEEALGGQAFREAAAEYAQLVERSRGASASERDSLLRRAEEVLRHAGRARENYHMIDDELQLPILVARWIADSSIGRERKRAFLLGRESGETRLALLLRELGVVARMTAPYARDATATNLISFAPRDSGRWAAASWRDSGVGYANGRYAMDVNAIWAPHALVALRDVVRALRALGFGAGELAGGGDELDRLLAAPASLDRAVSVWQGASRHFVVRLAPSEMRRAIEARLGALPAADRAYWRRALAGSAADRDSLEFLALALDAAGRPIRVANSDPATWLFLDAERPTRGDAEVLRDVALFARDYPTGLLVPQVGPVVANDAYATPAVWRDFDRDRYHSPHVVWGREVNLFLLGALGHLAEAERAGRAETAARLRGAVDRVMHAVEASGFHGELWSYAVRDGRVTPARYGTGADVQLWSTTMLAVQFALRGAR